MAHTQAGRHTNSQVSSTVQVQQGCEGEGETVVHRGSMHPRETTRHKHRQRCAWKRANTTRGKSRARSRSRQKSLMFLGTVGTAFLTWRLTTPLSRRSVPRSTDYPRPPVHLWARGQCRFIDRRGGVAIYEAPKGVQGLHWPRRRRPVEHGARPVGRVRR